MSIVSSSPAPMMHKLGKGKGGGGGGGGRRLLITVNVLGSAGPLRFVVGEEEAVSAVIQTALRSYAREGRLPVLGSDLSGFLLYCANSGADALRPWETIGSGGTRNFLLCRKQTVAGEAAETQQELTRKKSWRTWLNRSFSFNISSH